MSGFFICGLSCSTVVIGCASILRTANRPIDETTAQKQIADSYRGCAEPRGRQCAAQTAVCDPLLAVYAA
jgi:hypothetical protein